MRTQREALTPAARRVLDAAAELFYGQGINAVGVDLIAKRAGVTKKTLYERFGSKEALVAAYLRERDERWRAWLTAEVEKSPPAERVLATFDALAAWMRRENPRGCGFVNAAAELPDADHPARQVVAGQKRWLRTYLWQLCEEAGVAAPDELADELLLLHEGATVLYGLSAVADPVGISRRMALRALERAGAV
ncbi:TetR/AcrR family transcriptional regulator [Streptomyces sp. S465]|uniref:TetR/AcrR family transcriptional regulator n=1 Tax=Streptomyces sp. S465 TaxID=2979468 RepID=UPI0022A8A2B9|nr:TetR/AcrR family transcriptional regulator [Streptomyces sp. S465]WAP55362.1 helix-turn-helix domain containing protein [Streptomyces sp. S465]